MSHKSLELIWSHLIIFEPNLRTVHIFLNFFLGLVLIDKALSHNKNKKLYHVEEIFYSLFLSVELPLDPAVRANYSPTPQKFQLLPEMPEIARPTTSRHLDSSLESHVGSSGNGDADVSQREAGLFKKPNTEGYRNRNLNTYNTWYK